MSTRHLVFRYTFGLIVLLQVSVFAAPVIVETTSTSGLKHPGCLQSAAEINALATALDENNPTRTGYWDSMMGNPRGRVYKTDWIPPTNLSGTDFASPAKYAGAGLIRYINDWIINGNTTSEASAITMLNTWAGVQSWTADPDDGYMHHRLQSMWFGYLAHAGDLLISSNTSWPVTEQDAFKNAVQTIFLPIANDNRAAGFNANWDMGATWAVMSMAILLDDKALFDEQIAWLKDGETNARISYYLLSSGQNQESARDQGHSNMGLTFLSLCVQTAWTQGIDLYEYDNRSVAKAFEYNAAYNLGEDHLPFQVYPCAVGSNSAHDYNTEISDSGRPTYFSVYEMVYHHYKNYRNIELPHTKAMLENHTRPEGPGPNWSNHNSALYWNLDLSADAALRQAQSADPSLAINSNYAARAWLRLNCGGAHYGATDGRAFTKEKSVWNYGGSDVSTSNTIANTTEEALYQSYRQGSAGGSIYYHFGLPNGEYIVKLHFAEPDAAQAGQRVFNVYLEGTKILDNFDIFPAAGADTAYLTGTIVNLTDGQLDVQLQSVVGAPLINAIEIEPSLPYTLAYAEGTHGTLIGTTLQEVLYGADGTAITAVSDAGCRFLDWSDGGTANPRTDLGVTSNISVTANFASIDVNKVIIIKADDLRIPNQRWVDFVDVSRNMGIKVGIGAIVGDASAPTTTQWMQDQDAARDVEFWNHGFYHTVTNILIDMPLAQEGLRTAVGRYPIAFGSPFNKWNADIAAAVNAAPELKLVFTHGPSTVESQCPGVHAVRIHSENGGVGIPDADKFKADYPLGSTPGSLALQFHPSSSAWDNNNSMSEYMDIVQYLLDDGYSILLPTEYIALVDPDVTLTYLTGSNGSLSGVATQTVAFGESGTAVSAIPDSGYHFVDWSDGSIENPRTDEHVIISISITATFATNSPCILTYLAGPNGSISGETPQTVDYHADGTAVTAVAESDYHFVDWSDASTANPRTDLGVTSNISVTANFEEDAIDTTTNSLLLVDSAKIAGGGSVDTAFDNAGDFGLKDATGDYMRIALFKADLSTLSGTVEDASLTFLSKNDSTCNIYVWGVVDSGATGWDWIGGTGGDVTWNSVIANGLFTPKDHLYSTCGSELVLLGTFAVDGTGSPYNLTHTVSGTNLVNLLNADTDDILTFVVALDANVNLTVRNPATYTPAAELLVATSSGAELDTDGDGLTDALEVALGTDPNDPDSGFGIDGVPLPATGKIQITWPSATGVLYRVWKSADLTGWAVTRDWTNAQTPPEDSFELDLSPSNGFFKVEAEIQ